MHRIVHVDETLRVLNYKKRTVIVSTDNEALCFDDKTLGEYETTFCSLVGAAMAEVAEIPWSLREHNDGQPRRLVVLISIRHPNDRRTDIIPDESVDNDRRVLDFVYVVSEVLLDYFSMQSLVTDDTAPPDVRNRKLRSEGFHNVLNNMCEQQSDSFSRDLVLQR